MQHTVLICAKIVTDIATAVDSRAKCRQSANGWIRQPRRVADEVDTKTKHFQLLQCKVHILGHVALAIKVNVNHRSCGRGAGIVAVPCLLDITLPQKASAARERAGFYISRIERRETSLYIAREPH